jgi:hypothetical protein
MVAPASRLQWIVLGATLGCAMAVMSGCSPIETQHKLSAEPSAGEWQPTRSKEEQRNLEISATAIAARGGPQQGPFDPPTPRPGPSPTPLPIGRPAAAGIISEGKASGPWRGIIVGDIWYQTEGAKRAVVAGARRTDPDQGIVIVADANGDSGVYETPTRSGSLRIVDVNGERLELSSNDGAIFLFDVPTRQFVTSPDPLAHSVAE